MSEEWKPNNPSLKIRRGVARPNALIDIKGRRFGMLTVIGRSPRNKEKWVCRCDCGALCEKRSHALRKGKTLPYCRTAGHYDKLPDDMKDKP
jgi:hypothetical protein